MKVLWCEINKSFKKHISEKKIAGLIKKKKFPLMYRERLFILFTDVNPSLILMFAMEHGISLEELKDYYERFIKPVYRSRNFEEIFKI
ncbi:MAG: hypothetical protein ACP5QT_06635 [Brevinematia bacterium]